MIAKYNHNRNNNSSLKVMITLKTLVVVFILIALIKKFIRSRPPGRRLVTSDIQVDKNIDSSNGTWFISIQAINGLFRPLSELFAPQKSDISVVQVLQLNSVCLVVLSVTFPMAVRAVCGPMSFPAAFIATEALKVFELINYQDIYPRWLTQSTPVLPTFLWLFSFCSSGISGLPLPQFIFVNYFIIKLAKRC